MKAKILFIIALLLTMVQGVWSDDKADYGVLNGEFSVSAGKKVHFSQGNLQAFYNSSESWEWYFSTNQWDYVGYADGSKLINGNGTLSSTEHSVDLFCWSTNATYYGIHNSKENGTYNGSFRDWGTNAIINGGSKANIWYTPSQDEWTYLLNTRSGSTIGATANARYTYATINTDGTSENGMILFPDGVTFEASEATTWGTINNNSNWTTKCTTDQWSALEAKGCVFLPTAGWRSGADSGGGAEDRGRYWLATAKGDDSAYSIVFGTASGDPANDYYRRFGRSVRLVIESHTITYNANGGEGSVDVLPKYTGLDRTLSDGTGLSRSGYAFAGWNTQADGSGTHYASGATFTGNTNTTLYAQWTFQGSGIENDPYLIPSEDVWNYLADQVNGGTNYSGKYFQQTGDFTVSSKIIGHPTDDTHYVTFNGIYDGNGRTITASISKSDERYVAPFHCIANATIKNVIVTGSVTVSGSASIERRRHPAGLVGVTDGTCILQNCRVSANVSGCDYMGGLIGHTQAANITITGCVYSGTLTASDKNNTGGLIGWGGDNGGKTYTLTNNLFAGSYSGSGMFHPVGFLYNPTGNTRTVTNTYYMTGLQNVGDDNGNSLVKGLANKGKFAYSITAGSDVTVANAGTETEYNVSGITAYSHGIKYNDIYYAGDGDAVSLNLSHADKAGYTFNQYTVTGGGSLANPTTNTPTLTMTDANQTINAEWLENTATLSQATDNSTFISANNGLVYDITLGRTMNAGGWNTFAVPFDINPIPTGWTVKKLTGASNDGSTLTLTFGDATSIEAGKPYLVKVTATAENPTFDDVTISNSTTSTTIAGVVSFVPVINPTAMTAGDKTTLFVTGGNKLTYPNTTGNINGFRAYFQLPSELAARQFVLNFGEGDPTVVGEIQDSRFKIQDSSDDVWYDLNGRKYDSKPTKPGVYVHKGEKVSF